MKKYLLITDSDLNLKNGVSVTWNHMLKFLKKDFNVTVIEPKHFKTIPCPTYPEIPLALCYNQLDNKLFKSADYIHIATEGPIGLEARKICKKYKLKYTTSFHTNFADYLKNLIYPPLTYEYLKWFHRKSKAILVPTETTKLKLEGIGFKNLKVWSRGIDNNIFKIKNVEKYSKPTFVCVSRISKEKNLETFFNIKLAFDHDKIVIGDGPLLKEYKQKYKNVTFLGDLNHKNIADILNKCHVFVFPSKSDTFGIVMLEAIACGLPVIAFNIEGPKDIITCDVGILVEKESELSDACNKALKMQINQDYILDFTWKNVYDTLIEYSTRLHS